MFQAPNVGIGGRDHGNRESMHVYCYLVKFLYEDGTLACMEPFTLQASCADDARESVENEAEQQCEDFDYYDYECTLEDVH